VQCVGIGHLIVGQVQIAFFALPCVFVVIVEPLFFVFGLQPFDHTFLLGHVGLDLVLVDAFVEEFGELRVEVLVEVAVVNLLELLLDFGRGTFDSTLHTRLVFGHRGEGQPVVVQAHEFDALLEFLAELVLGLTAASTVAEMQIVVLVRLVAVGRGLVVLVIVAFILILLLPDEFGLDLDEILVEIGLLLLVVFRLAAREFLRELLACLLRVDLEPLLFEPLAHDFDLLVDEGHFGTEPLLLGAGALEGLDHVEQQLLVVLLVAEVVDLAEAVAAALHAELDGVEGALRVVVRQQVEVDFIQVTLGQALDEVVVHDLLDFEAVPRAFGRLVGDDSGVLVFRGRVTRRMGSLLFFFLFLFLFFISGHIFLVFLLGVFQVTLAGLSDNHVIFLVNVLVLVFFGMRGV